MNARAPAIGFTLIELLVVIAIISILAPMIQNTGLQRRVCSSAPNARIYTWDGGAKLCSNT